MSNSTFIKTMTATAAILANRIVQIGSADYEATPATAATQTLIGVSDAVGQDTAGDRVDVIVNGEADVKLGGTVTRGDFITAGAAGVGVAAAPSAGVNNGVIGIAMQSGVSDDIITVRLSLGQIQG